MAIKVAALSVEILRGGQPDRVKRDLQEVDRAGAKAGQSVLGLNNVLKGLGIGFSVAAITRGLKSAAGAFLDFDAAMTESLAIMGDVSAGMRTEMAETAKYVAKTTTFSASEAAQSYYYLASAGLDAQQSIAALPQVAQFAQAGMFDMARATDLATDAQSALGLTVDDAGQNLANLTRVTDVLVKANTLANASVEQFSEALTNKAGAALKVVGKDIEEGVAVLAAFADQGLKGAEAGTALNIVFRDLQTKALENGAAFADLGVTVFDAVGEMRNAADIIGDLEGALEGMSDEQKKATLLQLGFTDKSVSFVQTILGQSDAIRAYEEQLRSAGGATAEVAANQLESFKAQLKLTTDTLQSLIVTTVGTVAPMFGLKDGLVDVRGALEDAEWWVNKNQDALATWANVVTKSVSLVVQTFDLFGTAVFTTFKWAGDIIGNAGAMMMGSFKLIGDALGNLGALIVGVFTFDLDLIKTSLSEMGHDIVADFQFWTTAAGELVKDASADLQPIRDELVETADAAWELGVAMAGIRAAKGTAGTRPGPGTASPIAGEAGGGAPAGGGAGAGAAATTGNIGTSIGMSTGAAGWNVSDMLEAQIQNIRAGELFKLATDETLQMVGEMAGTIESGLENTLGDAIANGMKAAFDTGSLGAFFESFGKTMLAGFGDILVQLGKILIQYGLTMEALRPFLMNIFTAGPAAIAAGVALVALGSAFSAVVSSSGGGRAAMSAGGVRSSGSGFSQQMTDATRSTISMGPAPTIQAQPSIVYNNTIIGPDDPTAQRQLTEMLVKAQRRGLVLVP